MTEIDSILENDIHIISVEGEVDASSSIHLDNAMEEAFTSGHLKIFIDLGGLTYISSAGLGVFISRLDEINQKGIKLILFGMSDSVFQVFKILGLEKLLTIVNDKEQALKAVNEA